MDYKIEFSYINPISGRRVTENDTTYQFTAQDAADAIRKWYGYLDGLRIENIWKDTGSRWEITEAWD